MLLLDTSVVSALMRHDESAMRRLQNWRPGDIVLCACVAAEIRYGLERLEKGSRRRLRLEAEYGRLRDAVAWESWTEAAALEYGRIKASMERSGTPLDDMDLIIASIAFALGATVATRNPRHFTAIPDLAVESWADPP